MDDEVITASRLNPQDSIVFIVDDDRRVCESLSALLSTFDLRVVVFGSAAEYLAYPRPDLPGCLILDVELPDINGLELQRQSAQDDHPPIMFTTFLNLTFDINRRYDAGKHSPILQRCLERFVLFGA